MRWPLTVALLIGFTCWPVGARARGVDELAKRSSWTTPTPADIRTAIEQWVSTRPLDESSRRKLDALWSGTAEVPGGVDLLEHVAVTIAVVEPEASELVDVCRRGQITVMPGPFKLLTSDEVPSFVRSNLSLYYGRWLVQHDLYDEAALVLQDLRPQEVVDPATLLFYQGVVHHRLLDKDKCLVAVTTLLENEAETPRRYATVARLMEADIRPLETDSLDEVARLMDDIRRRLNFGRAGKRVRQQEDDVIAKLDKMIENLKKQQQQSSAASKSSNRSSKPAEDSRALQGRGPGDVDQKSIGDGSGWGNLPPKQREEALQQIGKDLPAHFRELIEEYFRKLARDGGDRAEEN